MLQQDKPEDYIIATGKQYSVRDFVTIAAKELNIGIDWQGKGIHASFENKVNRLLFLGSSCIYPKHYPQPMVVLIEPKVFGDHRGFFMETFRDDEFKKRIAPVTFVQDNHSKSSRGILRGLHYQIKHSQGKLVRVISGEVWDGNCSAPAG